MGEIRGMIKGFMSPMFLVMLFASFVFWYLSKLDYTYTTDLEVPVIVDDEEQIVMCVVEGEGVNLFHRIYSRKRLRIPLTELKHAYMPTEHGDSVVVVEPESMQAAIASRLSDIKVLSVRDIPEF